MPQSRKGTVHVDVGELEALAQRLEKLQDILHSQKLRIPSLKDELAIAISGTAPNIGKFDQQFDQWMQLLSTVAGEMDVVYHTFQAVLEEAREHDIAGVLEALMKGSKELSP